MPASIPHYVTEAIAGHMPDPPGVKLQKEGLKAKHPVVFVPGIVTGGLELWEGHQCAEGLFRKRLWGGTFGEVYKRSLFYNFCLILVGSDFSVLFFCSLICRKYKFECL
jgi:phospholipid:diacylglycerol acyltransferase